MKQQQNMNRQNRTGTNTLRSFLLGYSCLMLAVFVSAQSPSDLYKTGAQQYKSNQFEQASVTYEKILAEGYKTAEVYYNLGNCYYKMNQTAKAVLNFERAAKLAPEDEDIQHNLKLAGLKTTDKIQPVPQLSVITWWQNFIASHSSGGWAVYAVISIWISLLAFAVFFFIGWKRVMLSSGILFLVLSLCLVSLAWQQKGKEEQAAEAVLMISNVFVKSAPDANGNDLFMIHEGVKFRILDQVSTWYKIRLADGKVGWLEKGSFERI